MAQDAPSAWLPGTARDGAGLLHDFAGRDFLKLADFTPEEIGCFVDTAIELKLSLIHI